MKFEINNNNNNDNNNCVVRNFYRNTTRSNSSRLTTVRCIVWDHTHTPGLPLKHFPKRKL